MSMSGSSYAKMLSTMLADTDTDHLPRAIAQIAATREFPTYDSDEASECRYFSAEFVEYRWINNQIYIPTTVAFVHAASAYTLYHYAAGNELLPAGLTYAILGYSETVAHYRDCIPQQCIEFTNWVVNELNREPVYQWLASRCCRALIRDNFSDDDVRMLVPMLEQHISLGMPLVDGDIAHTVLLHAISSDLVADAGDAMSHFIVPALQQFAQTEARLVARKKKRWALL